MVKKDGEVECCFGPMMMEKKSSEDGIAEKRWSSVYANGELGQVAKRSSVCGFDEDGFVGRDE